MPESLKGKVALITGGATGLGREIALRLATEGMHLAIAYSRSVEEAETLISELTTLGVMAVAFQADLAQTPAAKGSKRVVAALWISRSS